MFQKISVAKPHNGFRLQRSGRLKVLFELGLDEWKYNAQLTANLQCLVSKVAIDAFCQWRDRSKNRSGRRIQCWLCVELI